MPTSVLLGERPATTNLSIYGDEQPAHDVNGLHMTTCSGFAGSRSLEAVRVSIEPDRTAPAFARHRGEE